MENILKNLTDAKFLNGRVPKLLQTYTLTKEPSYMRFLVL